MCLKLHGSSDHNDVVPSLATGVHIPPVGHVTQTCPLPRADLKEKNIAPVVAGVKSTGKKDMGFINLDSTS